MLSRLLDVRVLIGAGVAFVALLSLALIVYYEPFPRLAHGNARADAVFSDCVECPEMLPIPAGEFIMGDVRPSRKETWFGWLGVPPSPYRSVTIEQPFAMGRTEVTFAQWEACVADAGCEGYLPPDEGWGRGEHPVIHVSWNDAQSYVVWLREKTGQPYRLPTEAEWEYAARAGSGENFPWGRYEGHGWANYGSADCPPCRGLEEGRDHWFNTAPVASFPPNAWGLYDTQGNVYEWVEDCHTLVLPLEAATGEALLDGDCAYRKMRGGAWYSSREQILVFYRSQNPPEWEDWVIGFRVARSMPES